MFKKPRALNQHSRRFPRCSQYGGRTTDSQRCKRKKKPAPQLHRPSNHANIQVSYLSRHLLYIKKTLNNNVHVLRLVLKHNMSRANVLSRFFFLIQRTRRAHVVRQVGKETSTRSRVRWEVATDRVRSFNYLLGSASFIGRSCLAREATTQRVQKTSVYPPA